MKEYALLHDGEFREIRRYEDKPSDIPHKKFSWHPVVRETGQYFEGLRGEDWAIVTPPPEPQIPNSITPRQCRLLLLSRGMLSSVNEMIAGQDEATRITWEYATEFRRDNQLLVQLSTALGLSPDQVDEFFVEASKI